MQQRVAAFLCWYVDKVGPSLLQILYLRKKTHKNFYQKVDTRYQIPLHPPVFITRLSALQKIDYWSTSHWEF